MPRSSSAPLLVRLAPATRTSLVEVSAANNQTMSQIVRDATIWWVNNPARTCPVVSAERATTHQDFINVRFSADDMANIRLVAEEMGLERGGVVRCAIRAWLLTQEKPPVPDQPAAVAV